MASSKSFGGAGNSFPWQAVTMRTVSSPPTPNAILESSRALPIGYWKGSGLVLVLGLMASLIAAGDSTREISQREEETGVSQAFVAIDLVSQTESANVDGKVNAI